MHGPMASFFDVTAIQMKTYLEDLLTIHAVNVDVVVGENFNERTWIINLMEYYVPERRRRDTLGFGYNKRGYHRR